MTREEWKRRCAARFMQKLPWLTAEAATVQAQKCFEMEQMGEEEYNSSAIYHPEDCADEEIKSMEEDQEKQREQEKRREYYQQQVEYCPPGIEDKP